MKQIKVVIADDQTIVLEGLTLLVNKIRQTKVVYTTTNGYDLMTFLHRTRELPDLVMIDLEMPGPGGKNTLADLRHCFKDLRILIVTGYLTPAHIVAAFRKGANGFVSKNLTARELQKAIIETFEKGFYLSKDLSAKVPPADLKLLTKTKPSQMGMKHDSTDLTPDDMELVQYLSIGLTSQEIAVKMNLGKRTIEGKRLRLLQKTDAVNTADLIRTAKEKGWCQ